MFTCCAAQATSTEQVIVSTSVVEKTDGVEDNNNVSNGAQSPAPSNATNNASPNKEIIGMKEPVTEFNLVVTKGEKQLGLDIVTEGRKGVMDTLFVENVRPDGLAAAYNATADPEIQIMHGDYIACVNKVMGAGMLARLQQDQELDIIFMRSHEVAVSVPKDGTLGMEIAYQEGKNYLFVKAITEGAVQRYNLKCSPAKRVKVPSRILAVNGFRGTAPELFVKLSMTKDPLQMVLHQPQGVKAEIWEA